LKTVELVKTYDYNISSSRDHYRFVKSKAGVGFEKRLNQHCRSNLLVAILVAISSKNGPFFRDQEVSPTEEVWGLCFRGDANLETVNCEP